MENKKYLDSGKITQYNKIKKDKYKLLKKEYKKEKTRLNMAHWSNWLEQSGVKFCVITSAVASGAALTAAFIVNDFEMGVMGTCLGAATVGFGLIGRGMSTDRKNEIKEIKEKKKVLKKEYKMNKNTSDY